MDYFAKFRKRIAPKAQPTSQMQLSKFHKCWEYIHNIFTLEDRKTNVHVQQTEIPSKLRQMVDLLVDEEARHEDNTTGLCMEYFLKNGILQYLVTVAEKEDYPVGMRGEAIRMVANMIDLLDDRFLVHNAIHKPTIKLLRFCVLDDRQSELNSEDLVDLMYIICSKIHGFPALLNIFFHDKIWLTTPQKNQSLEPHPLDDEIEQPHEYEFLLFTYLLRFVHREGRSGDFARTGLLFLIEMATGQLGDFILGSDFATIMAAALGALFSQLPRKLIVQDEAEQLYANPTSYLLSQDTLDDAVYNNNRFPAGLGIEYSNSAEFKYQLDSFLKLLEFHQDVLNRCPNADICIALLKSVKSNFLENILYPSILECSDIDGSSVAVISYIDLILQTVQQGDLSTIMVGYLMGDVDIDQEIIQHRSKKIALNSSPNPKPKPSSLTHFNLKDLIFSRLESKSQPTVIATLKLLKTLVVKHCHYSLKLLSVQPDTNRSPIIISHHLREIELYFSLITAINADNANSILSNGYDEYLRDLENTIDCDGCYQTMKPMHGGESESDPARQESPKITRRRSFKYGQRNDDMKKELDNINENPHKRDKQQFLETKRLFRHRVRSTDPLLQILLSLLSHFFTQSTELNLALTGVISALALCPYRSLEGWISFSESDRTNRDDILVLHPEGQASKPKVGRQDIYANFESTPIDDNDENDDRSIDFGVERRSGQNTIPTFFKSYPPFFTLLRTLTQQVDYYRSEIQTFDSLLDERRNALISGEVSFIERGPRKVGSTPVLSPSSSVSTASPRPPMNVILSNPVAPLTVHVKKTSNTRIQPLFPSHFVHDREEPILDLDDEDEHTFSPKVIEPSRSKRLDKSTEISLSMLLNNVVILEEAIKELIALIQVRRSMGIDEITYI